MRDWNALGVTWMQGKVARQAGKNVTDKTFYPEPAPHLTIPAENIERFLNAHKEDGLGFKVIAAKVNGQSLRVGAQRIVRDYFKSGGHLRTPAEIEAIKEKQYSTLILGVRAAATIQTVVREVKVYILPNGEKYEGTDEVEYQQLVAAALVEKGVDGSTAVAIASGFKL